MYIKEISRCTFKPLKIPFLKATGEMSNFTNVNSRPNAYAGVIKNSLKQKIILLLKQNEDCYRF